MTNCSSSRHTEPKPAIVETIDKNWGDKDTEVKYNLCLECFVDAVVDNCGIEVRILTSD